MNFIISNKSNFTGVVEERVEKSSAMRNSVTPIRFKDHFGDVVIDKKCLR